MSNRDIPDSNLFLEVMDLAMASITCFALSDVRRIARRQLEQYHQDTEMINQGGVLTYESLEFREADNNITEGASNTTTSAALPKLPLEDCHKVLQLPLTMTSFLDIWERNKTIFEQDSLWQTAVKGAHLLKTRDYIKAVVEPYLNATMAADHQLTHERICEYMGDENESTECVHYIVRDDKFQRLTLAFRGSITIKDWLQDSQCVLTSIPNPAFMFQRGDDDTSTVSIHHGFRHYLYDPLETKGEDGTSKSQPASLLNKITEQVRNPTAALPNTVAALASTLSSARLLSMATSSSIESLEIADTNNNEDGKEEEEVKPREASNTAPATTTKIQIVLHQLRTLKAKYPHYEIHVAGHSLGGALALIAALEIASDPILASMPKNNHNIPVTCVTFGNPKAGNSQFVQAMQQLEQAGRLQCLCFHNNSDVVPMLPPNIPMEVGFFHVGLCCVLHSDGRMELGRANDKNPILSYGSNTDGNSPKKLLIHLMDYLQGSSSSNNNNSDCAPPQQLIRDSSWRKSAAASDEFTPTPEPVVSSSPQEEEQQQIFRINQHDYREYLDRLVRLKEVLTDLTLDGIYEEWQSIQSLR